MSALAAIVVAIIVRMVAGSTMDIQVSEPNSHSYHRQDMKRGEFDYGYHVNTVSNQFQHKVKGPDDVTYGCYGYVDPSNRKHLVYYVADRMGYRIIFPNRATKIFTAKLADSLNKLDGSVKGKDYDERVVEWNNLYLPESCFRLNEILETAATDQQPQRTVVPAQPPVSQNQQRQPAGPVPSPQPGQRAPELPRPTQYTNPNYSVDEQVTDLYGEGSADYGQRRQGPGVISVQEQQPYPGSQQQPNVAQPGWPGSLPDINPANINLDQFNGQVYPIHTGGVAYGGAGGEASQGTVGTNGQLSPYNLNITQLLAQIEAVNSQVITLNMLLAGMAANPTAFANANENSCRSVVQLLKTQNRTPQLVYVPIMIPYAEGQYNVNQPIVPPRPDAHRQRPGPGAGCKGC
uniref:Putative secreted protein n=2 Tax=Anopheles marajoara TaxID=58244 RepID=A0A2M4BQ96_9DIPT